MKIEITEKEFGVIMMALNDTFHKCMKKLEKMDNLGDIERQLTHIEKDNALELIKKLENI